MKKPNININKENMIKAGVGVALVAAVMGSGAYFHNYKEKTYENLQAEILASQTTEEVQESNVAGFDYSSIPWKQMGYSDLQTYWGDMQEKRESIKGIADEYIDAYGSKMTEEDKKNLRWHESRMLNAIYPEDFEEAYNDFISLASQFIPKQTYSGGGYYNMPNTGLTKSGGVNYYGGRKETYYSSRVLYHYRTGEWWVDDEGFYRTASGNYVVAASDMSQGTTFEGSKGTCEVLDTGCAAGITDYYVAW